MPRRHETENETVAKVALAKVGYALFSMFVLLVLVFAMVRLTGDPTRSVLPADALPEQRERLRRELLLDQPLPVQFAAYLGKLAQGDLGLVIRGRVPVLGYVAARFPATLTLAAGALVLILTVGVPLGIYSAYRQGTWIDRVGRAVAALGQSVPSFWLGYLLILVFAVSLNWVPSGGYGRIENMILPVVALSFGPIAGLTRLLRSSMIEVLNSDYVMFLRAKGLSERMVLWKHAFRNAGLTTLSYLGIVVAGLLTGSVMIETVFVWPGVGRLMIEGIQYRDFPVVQGVILLYATIYIVVNLIVDLLYVVLNPKLR